MADEIRKREKPKLELVETRESDKLLAQITKVHGPNVMRRAIIAGHWKHIPLDVFTLDMAMFGGLPRSAISMFYGWEAGGKALALDTPIPTPHGWSTMGALTVGDQVLDEDGLPCRVTFATEVQLGRQCFEVAFSDGAKIVADAEHLWHVESRYAANEVAPRVMTTAQLRADLFRDYGGGDIRYRWRVPVAKSLQLPTADLPVEPYALGAWLGDGETAGTRFTTVDDEMLDNLRAVGCVIVVNKTMAGRVTPHAISAVGDFSFRTLLQQTGLIGNKHIPAAYLRASHEQRVALLQGLMDSDGYGAGRRCEFVTIRPALRDGFMELARTLGLKPSLCEDRARLNGRDCGPRYRVSFRAKGFNPFRLTRKAERITFTARRDASASRTIIAIEPVPSVPVRCIQVDSPNHLYLAGRDMVPTHNTTLGMRAIAAAQRMFPDQRAALIDAEGTYDPVWGATHGIDNENLLLVQPETGEQALDIANGLLRSADISIVMVDSLPALVPQKEQEKSLEDDIVAMQARLIGRFIRVANAAILDERKRDHLPALLLINQWRSKIAFMGDTRNLPGGNALKFFVFNRVEIMNKEVLGKDQYDVEIPIHNDHSFKVTKNKEGTGIRNGAFTMIRDPGHRLGAGFIDDAETVLAFAKKFGIFTGAGASQRYDDLDQTFRTMKDAAEYLYSDLDFFDRLKHRLVSMQREHSGLSPTDWL